MYYVTDPQQVADAAEAKTPRPVGEVLREHYPDATIDAHGQAHAPHEGYEVDGLAYRAGEYLPLPESVEYDRRGNDAPPRRVWLMTPDGSAQAIEGTPAMLEAAKAEARRQQLAHDTTTAFVGTPGQREVWTLTIQSLFTEEGFYGPEHAHTLRDAVGNRVIYRGGKVLGRVGETIRVKATVKKQGGERPYTIINRPALL